MKSAAYKCSLLNFLYIRPFPVGHALETGAAGWTTRAAITALEPLREKTADDALGAEANVPGKGRSTLEMLGEKAVKGIDFSK